ncbi:DUF317 domain-containing protein [Streptomyces goshikiensis]|uniref:DUF317 domain-containing protein n=1 Tax=Streptomyces goshikiensis TaxID=1942 RepID=UPI0019C1AB1A|nr:DUF317 domain-containing protein [Streptomyces goshikiensis]GHD79316.1 hypothetical protein GCM10010336_61120 [Streptomyces goshikiensis]
MTVDTTQPGFSTTVEALRLRSWCLGPGQSARVIDQFTDKDFKLVVDDRADVHVNSRDGRFYLGWFPTGRPGTEDDGWVLAVTGTATTPGYRITFDTETPAQLVAAVVAEVIATSAPVRSP